MSKVVNLNNQQTSISFPSKVHLDGKIVINPTIDILLAAGWRHCHPLDIPEGFRAVNIVWVQDEEDPRYASATFDLIDIAAEEAQKELAWQNNKSVELKMIENVYVDFLTNDWTPALRTAELIPIEHTITVDNTDENTNIGLLLHLRQINKTDYYNMAGEFDRFRSTILRLGGIMAKVKEHVIT